MSKVKLYDADDVVQMEVEPVDAREILAQKDCNLFDKTKAVRDQEKKAAKAAKSKGQ